MNEIATTDLAAAIQSLGVACLTVITGWALVVVALGSLPRTAGLAQAITPPILRCLLTVGVCGAMATGSPAQAGELDGLRLPDRPATAPRAAHVVKSGDSLWAVAESHLIAGAPTATVASATAAWYELNRRTIGPNPHLILPGQRLVVPAVYA